MASKPVVWLYSSFGGLEMERLEVVCYWLFPFSLSDFEEEEEGEILQFHPPPVLTTLKQQHCLNDAFPVSTLPTHLGQQHA